MKNFGSNSATRLNRFEKQNCLYMTWMLKTHHTSLRIGSRRSLSRFGRDCVRWQAGCLPLGGLWRRSSSMRVRGSLSCPLAGITAQYASGDFYSGCIFTMLHCESEKLLAYTNWLWEVCTLRLIHRLRQYRFYTLLKSWVLESEISYFALTVFVICVNNNKQGELNSFCLEKCAL